MVYDIKLLMDLIAAASTADRGELEAGRVIQRWLEPLGVDVRLDSWGSGRANVVAQLGPAEAPAVVFASHLDVVPEGSSPWRHEPFSPALSKGCVFGRGAVDMKGPIAVQLWALKQLLDEGFGPAKRLVLAFVAGEETDSCGVKRFVENFSGTCLGVIVPEPTNFEIVTAHRGILWLAVKTIGRTAHGSMPEQGINAITSMRRFLDELDGIKLAGRDKVLGSASISVNTIGAGQAVNVIPDMCTAEVDIRTVPGQSHEQILARIEDLLAGLGKKYADFSAQVEIIRSVPALHSAADSDFVREFCQTVEISQTKGVAYTTDGPFLAELGAPVVIFGPGKTDLCHKPDEYIETAQLEKGIGIYKKIIRAFAG